MTQPTAAERVLENADKLYYDMNAYELRSMVRTLIDLCQRQNEALQSIGAKFPDARHAN